MTDRKYIKYVIDEVVFREFPDEVTLALNISGCPNHCPGCHSSYLANDIGTELTEDVLDKLINDNKGITCIGFMGGDNNPKEVVRLSMYVKEKYPNLHTGWYSGREVFPLHHGTFDYIKLGPWKEECGPLTSKTTNQVMYMKVDGDIDNPIFVDITKKAFQSAKPWETDYLENNDNV